VEGRIKVKVYYEDTDCLGVVYYANYLKYYERGRTEYINELGKPIAEWNAEGANFAVFKMDITWFKPARLGDEIDVVTVVEPGTPFRMRMSQKLLRGEELINEANVQLVCLDERMELREFPDELR
jgi:acyl-CoA thioester hydrolase